MIEISQDVKIEIPQEVRIVMNDLQEQGHPAYLVGGCVRDALMGRIPSDYDVTTSARPEEVRAVFKDYLVLDTGIKHGTVTVHINHFPVEVTTFRKDAKYSDGRHPDDVEFSLTLEDDLDRRDFTVNALAYRPEEGIVDLFGGQKDIADRIIRTVGNPRDRFEEDGLRILRGLRFASQLGFEIEEKTGHAIRENKAMLEKVSVERFFEELSLLLLGDNAEKVLMDYPDVLGVIIPEIIPMVGFDQKNEHHIYDVYDHTVKVLAGVPATRVLRLAAFFHDMGKPSTFTLDDNGTGHFYGHEEVSAEMAEKILRRLHSDNSTKDKVVNLVRWHGLLPEPTRKSVKRALTKICAENFSDWLAIKRGDNAGQAKNRSYRLEKIDAIEKIANEIIAENECFSLKDLAVGGADMLEIGIPKGPLIGKVLGQLLEMVIDEEAPNEREALRVKAKEVYKNYMP